MSVGSLYGAQTDPRPKGQIPNKLQEADGVTLMESPVVNHISYQPIGRGGTKQPNDRDMMQSLQVAPNQPHHIGISENPPSGGPSSAYASK